MRQSPTRRKAQGPCNVRALCQPRDSWQARNSQNARGGGQAGDGGQARWTDRLDWHGPLACRLSGLRQRQRVVVDGGRANGQGAHRIGGLDVAETIEKAIAKRRHTSYGVSWPILRCTTAPWRRRCCWSIPPIPKSWAEGSSIYEKKGRAEAGAQGERLQSVFGAGAVVYHRSLGQTVCRPQAG